MPCCRDTDLLQPAWAVGWGYHILVLAAAVLNRQDFTNGTPINWYTTGVAFVLAGMVALYVAMSVRKMMQRSD